MRKHSDINKPSQIEVEKYLKLWDSLENYTLQESSLRKLFTKTYPLNNDLDDILIKVCALNDFYSTNILSPLVLPKKVIRESFNNNLMDEIAGLNSHNHSGAASFN